jgi:hypothetical protein
VKSFKLILLTYFLSSFWAETVFAHGAKCERSLKAGNDIEALISLDWVLEGSPIYYDYSGPKKNRVHCVVGYDPRFLHLMQCAFRTENGKIVAAECEALASLYEHRSDLLRTRQAEPRF